jgi:hypothetical protein
MVIAENLAEEKSQGDQRGEDPVTGFANLLCDDFHDPLRREDLAENQIGVKDH